MFSWHAAIFPAGYSGLVKIVTGRFRDDRDGPMRVVSRRGMLERVHFAAPPADCLKVETRIFLHFINGEAKTMPWLARAAVAHL